MDPGPNEEDMWGNVLSKNESGGDRGYWVRKKGVELVVAKENRIRLVRSVSFGTVDAESFFFL